MAVTNEEQRLVIPVDPEGTSVLAFAPDGSGWAVFWDAPGEDHLDFVRVRFGRASEGEAFTIRELHVTSRQAISSRSLRTIPLARLEAAVNRPEHHEGLSIVQMPPNMVSYPWPDDLREPGHDRKWWMVRPIVATSPTTAPLLKLDIPEGYGRPDDFYYQVARRFAYLTTTSTRPANELAEANDVPVTTVHGWVKEARKRGFLPPGRKRNAPPTKEA